MHKYSRFESELIVRPDNIDMNNHVHNSRYFDYILAARYDQMKRCYKMPMNEFVELGLTWVVKTCFIEYKRPLFLGDVIVVRTWIEEMFKTGVKVGFEIYRKETNKLASNGLIEYAMIDAATGRSRELPAVALERYSV